MSKLFTEKKRKKEKSGSMKPNYTCKQKLMVKPRMSLPMTICVEAVKVFFNPSMASLFSFSLPKPNIIKASSASAATTVVIPENLDEKFGRKGIKFSESNNIPIVVLTVRNGSSVRLSIPDAHVTSYKPKVEWKDDGFEEVLYTVGGADSGAKARGGIGLAINDASEAGSKGSLISSSQWTVKDVDSDTIDALQVSVRIFS